VRGGDGNTASRIFTETGDLDLSSHYVTPPSANLQEEEVKPASTLSYTARQSPSKSVAYAVLSAPAVASPSISPRVIDADSAALKLPLETPTFVTSEINAASYTSPQRKSTLAAKLPLQGLRSRLASLRHHKDVHHMQLAKNLKNRNATNLRRKVLHSSFGVFFAILNHSVPKRYFVPGMACLTSATLIMELLRYRPGFGWMNTALHTILGSSLRKHELQGKFTGSFYFFAGVTLSAAMYSRTAATMGILQLAIADPMASYFGRKTRHVYWSRIENGFYGLGRNKGWLGFVGGALCCLPVNYRILSLAKFAVASPSRSQLLLASTALGMAGALADLAVPTPAWVLNVHNKPWKLGKLHGRVTLPPFHVDDNMVVPLFSAWACTQIFNVMKWSIGATDLSRFIVA
jgi:dolichol kinase